MPAWNPLYLIFNDSIIQESSGSPRWSNTKLQDETTTVIKPFRQRPLWSINLSGLLLSKKQYEELLAFQWDVKGMQNPFLVRNSRNCMFNRADGSRCVLGVGNGVQTAWQLTIPRSIQGRTNYEIIKHPNYNYPDLKDMHDRAWNLLPETEIYVVNATTPDPAEVPVAATMNVNTGIVTLSVAPTISERVEAAGGFYTLMRCNEDEIPVTPKGPMYQIDSGVTFTEELNP